MIRVLFLIINLFITLAVLGQSVPKLRKIADEAFFQAQYNEAIEFYEKVVALDKKDNQSKYNLAMSYYRTLQYEEARDTFLEITKSEEMYLVHRSFYYYGTILKLSSQFAIADSIFSHLITQPNVDDELLDLSSKQKEGCQLAMSHNTRKNTFNIEEMGNLNSKLHDYGAILNPLSKNVVFVTTRSLQSKQYEDIRYDGVLPDLVQFTKKGKNWNNVSSRQKFDNLNSKWSEGSGSFTADGESFYFTSCQTNNGADCQIMVSNLINEKWSKPRPLNDYINLEGFENKHPFITGGEDTLFFSSDRSGGFGGSDIWMSLKGTEQDSWTPAINLGGIINTGSNEITPHFSTDYGCLLFASDGHVGYGGFDLFAAKGESFFEPEIYNLGDPFNSALDDTYFYISDTLGFISSNRKDKTHLNLYSFLVKNERNYLSLLISDESLIDQRIVAKYREIRSLDLTSFRVEDYQGFELFDPVKRNKPKPTIILIDEEEEANAKDQPSNLMASTQTYNPPEETVQTTERRLKTTSLMGSSFLSSLVKTKFENLYFDHGAKHLTPAGKLSLNNLMKQLKSYDDESQYIEIVSNTDDVGSEQFNYQLSVHRGEIIRNYLIAQGFPSDKIIISAMGETNLLTTGTSWYERLFNRRTTINIYGDFNLDLKRSRLLVLRQDMTLQEISDVLGFTRDELNSWNQLRSENLKKGDIVRVDGKWAETSIKYFLDETDVKYNFIPYTVKENDTVESIARKFGNPEELLVELNQIKDQVQLGDELFIYKVN